MIRRPPRSTLFPTRRSSDLLQVFGRVGAGGKQRVAVPALKGFGFGVRDRCRIPRSEEHTSELQSQFHLVCRLLLEKKKKINKDMPALFYDCNKHTITTMHTH